MVEQTRTKRKTNIFNLEGNVYAFDSTTIVYVLKYFGGLSFANIKEVSRYTPYMTMNQNLTAFSIEVIIASRVCIRLI